MTLIRLESEFVALEFSVMRRLLCEDTFWVCENHPTRPWEGEHACTCAGARAPCPMCNSSELGDAPRMPDGFKTEVDKDGWRH
jgi:hypothetical protein